MDVDCNLKITVHNFIAVREDAPPSGTILQWQRGRDLVLACSHSDRWVTPHSAVNPSAFTLRRDRLYQYRLKPPLVTTRTRLINIPEWGQPSHSNDPDHFRLRDLQDFESTHIQTSFVSNLGKRMQDGTSCVDQPTKRVRLEVARILIPQPHFIPAPAGDFKPVDTDKIPHYSKAAPSPIAPYDAAAVDHLLGSTYRRAAWLIPVRGSLPWDGASTAMVLEEAQLASHFPSVSAAQPDMIKWTPSSLRHLWAFLGSIQQAKHLGPLSLSFHAASADAISAGANMSEPVWASNHPYYPQSSGHISVSMNDSATDISRAHLEDMDYIKIYHDVPYSLSLRNILDAYRYQPADGQVPGRSDAKDRKIRILKGAHLVLMDEHSKAAFLM